MALNQKPMSFHFAITPLNCCRIDDLIEDFKLCIDFLATQNIPYKKDEGILQLYGACAKIPDGPTKSYILKNLIDTYQDV